MKFVPEKAKTIVAINTTHGTGTEVDRFAVASIVRLQTGTCIRCDLSNICN